MIFKKRVLLIGTLERIRGLALSLIERHYDVNAVCAQPQEAKELTKIDHLEVVLGDVTDPRILDEANASLADISIALCDRDDANLVASELCKKQFGVPKTVSLLTDPEKSGLFHAMGVDEVVSSSTVITDLVEQQVFIGSTKHIKGFDEGRIHVAESIVSKNSSLIGHAADDETVLPDNAVLGAVVRNDNVLTAQEAGILQRGDHLIIVRGARTRVERVKDDGKKVAHEITHIADEVADEGERRH